MNDLEYVDSDTAIRMMCEGYHPTVKAFATHFCMVDKYTVYLVNTKEFFAWIETKSPVELEILQSKLLKGEL